MRTPVVGDKMLYWPGPVVPTRDTLPSDPPQPFDATVCFVNGPLSVNLRVTTHTGRSVGRHTVYVWNGEGERPVMLADEKGRVAFGSVIHYAEWPKPEPTA